MIVDGFSRTKIPLLLIFLFQLLALATPQVSQANVSKWCADVLTQEQYDLVGKQVDEAIAQRTVLVRQGKPFLVRPNGELVDLIESMNREFAKPILDQNYRQITNHIQEISRRWSQVAKEVIRARYEQMKKRKEQIEVDADGLPLTPTVQKYRDLALDVVAKAKSKLGPSEIEQQLAAVLVDNVRKTYMTVLKKRVSQIIATEVDRLAETLNEAQPQWSAVRDAAEPILLRMKRSLKHYAPIEGAKGKNAEQLNAVLETPLPAATGALMNAEGVVELQIPELAARVYYDVELGTLVLESNKGMVPNEDGILFVMDHGDGTNVSNASSWKYTLAKFAANNLNPVAVNLPKAGVGMEIEGLMPTITYMDKRFHVLASRAKLDETGAPMMHFGRSMGAQKGLEHALLHSGKKNPVSAYVLMSLSNPLTFDLQVKLVENQVANGTIKGVMPEVLRNAREISQQFLELLNTIKTENPQALEYFGEHLLLLQGMNDRDGGPTVVADAKVLLKQTAPLAHLYVFENPLEKYSHLKERVDRMGEDGLEASHNLFSNLPNYSTERGKALFPGANPVDYPAMQDQNFEAFAVIYGFADFLADSRSPVPQVKEAARVFQQYRQKLTGLDKEGKQITLLEWYRERNGITPQEFATARPGRESKAARLKRVDAYWKERARLSAEFWKLHLDEFLSGGTR